MPPLTIRKPVIKLLRAVSDDIRFFRPHFVALSPEWCVSFVEIAAIDLFDSGPELSLATNVTRDPKLRRVVVVAAAALQPLLLSTMSSNLLWLPTARDSSCVHEGTM
ncbi:unnamed protein product [Polarella glacialis]|uniref:Uncharacterized protein n=1 Tax=Polarella glacialis TaxID=89957 RepID=A0A813KHU6_POLGL|nr:unnamed protein product [Polarella glacialis]